MVVKYSRAQRRHDRARLKKKRQGYWGYGYNNWRGFDKMPKRIAGLLLNTPTPCSCWMCGNPRRTLSDVSTLTMQERKAYDNYLDWVTNVNTFNATI